MCRFAKQHGKAKNQVATAAAGAPIVPEPVPTSLLVEPVATGMSAVQSVGALQKQDSSSVIPAAGNARPATVASWNSKKRRVSGTQRPSARARSGAGVGGVPDTARLVTRPGGGGGKDREASTGAGPLLQPSAAGSPGAGTMTGLSAMAKLAPQILDTATLV